MRIRLSKKIVFNNLQYRIFGVLIFILCIAGVRYWQQPLNESVTGSYLVRLQPELEDIEQNRDLSEYIYGGRIPSCFYKFLIPPQKCEALQEQAREFILDNWKNRNRAYIILEYSGSDVGGENYVFIESDSQNKWQIVWNSDYDYYGRGFQKNIISKYSSNVKRVDSHKNCITKTTNPILIFLDKNKNLVNCY